MSPSPEAPFDLWLLLQQANAVPAGVAANDLDLAMAVEGGLPIVVLLCLLELHLLEAAEVPVIMSMQTYQQGMSKPLKLNVEESDRLVRIVRLTMAASDALGDLERGKQWLRTPNAALRGLRPLDLLRTSVGTRVVEQVLGRVDHGIGF
jgi:putative toxin-antitoxin system antitoxin component (TIGR02293 family)